MNQISAAKPSIWIFRLFGLQLFTIKDSRALDSWNLKFYAILQLITFLFLFIRGLYDREVYINGQKNNVGNTVDFVQLLGIRIAHLVVLMESIVQSKSLAQFFNELHDVDLLMMKNLNIVLDFQAEQKKYFYYFMSVIVFYLGAEGVVLCTFLLRKDTSLISYWVSYLIPYLVCCFRYYQTINCVGFIRKRLQLLNKKLEETRIKAKVEIPTKTSNFQKRSSKIIASIGLLEENYLKFSGSNNGNGKLKDPCMEKLINLKQLYDRLYDLANLVNQSFGLSMLVNIGNDFVAITSNCYFIFLAFQNVPVKYYHVLKMIGSFFWSLPHIVNVVLIAGYCHMAVQISNKTALLIHKIDFDLTNEFQNLFIQQFSMQLFHQKLAFTAFGFFNIDFTLLFTIIGSTTTFLIILIQFHITETNNALYQANSTSVM